MRDENVNKASDSEQQAARESAMVILTRQVEQHARELAGWRWLATAMEVNTPTKEEEASLWSILSRARRERY